MNLNVGILWRSFGPYHVARIEALEARLEELGARLVAFRFTRNSKEYAWGENSPRAAGVVTLSAAADDQSTNPIFLAYNFLRAIQNAKIHVVFLPSFAPFANFLCVFAAKLAGCRIVLMTDSWSATGNSGWVSTLVKKRLVALFGSAFVAGRRHVEYVCSLGMPQRRIFVGYDVVDVEYYSRAAAHWRTVPYGPLPVIGLPGRYFLSLGRFVKKKNLCLLIEAYADLVQRNRSLGIQLVFVGEGEQYGSLVKLAVDRGLAVLGSKDPDGCPGIRFFAFQQASLTPLFFARCEAFVLPSLKDEWGLVVNEAMACGVPVIVSENVGCSSDLVKHGENGFVIDPQSIPSLVNALERFVADPLLSRRMGTYGQSIIQEWGLERFAQGAVDAVAAASTGGRKTVARESGAR